MDQQFEGDRRRSAVWPYRWADAPWLIATGAAYAVLAKTQLTFYSTNGLVTVFWPGAGLALAALLAGGRKYAPALYLGVVAGQLWVGKSLGEAALLAVGSTLEALLGAWLLSRNSDFNASLRSTRDFLRLIYLAAALSPAVCAVIGVGTLLGWQRIAAADLGTAAAQWWMGDALGMVLVAPLILIWRQPPRLQSLRSAEAAALLGVSFLLGQVIFLDWFHEAFGPLRLGYWMFLMIFWVAVRLGRHAVTLVLLMATLQSLLGSALGIGLLGREAPEMQMVNFWAYTLILSTVGLTLATLLEESQAATAQLRASEDRLRLAKNAGGLAVYDHDVLAGKLKWDERARDLFGLGPDDPVSYAAFIGGVHADDRAATQAAVDRAYDAAGTGDFAAEYRVVNRADGSVRHVAANGRVFFRDGRAERAIGVMRDVSERKRLELELQARRSELEALTRQEVAAQTAAALAHELNQPLIAVSAYSEAALRMIGDGLPSTDKLERALHGAVQQTQRAGRTLHQLLNVLRKGDVVFEPVDLRQTIHQALESTAESGHGDIRTLVELESELPPLLANSLQLEKVLSNLLGNAAEAMRGAGVVDATIVVAARALPGTKLVQVSVQDSGPGVDSATARRVFEPFFTTKPNGLGLGLAISRALIEAHGGQLWLDAASGAGASFHFTLPVAP